MWDEDVVLHELLDGDIKANWVFDPHSFSPLCKLENGQLYSFINDHLGTPREMVDQFGRIAWRADYFAWGEVREKKAGDVDCPVRFQGQWFDEESGFHYNRFRYYDPIIRRFICCDPIGLAGGINQYQYSVNPVYCIDPLGYSSEKQIPPYDPRIRQRAVEDPGGHNFPFSFDEMILSTKPTTLRGGGEGYAIRGTKNDKEVVYNIIVKNGKIVHRDMVSVKKWKQRAKSFGWNIDVEDIPKGECG